MTSFKSLHYPRRTTLLPSEYQLCLCCASRLSTERWACVDCRMLIKRDLHEQTVSVYRLDGQPLMSSCPPFPGSLTLREARYALSPTFQTHASDLIQFLPLGKVEYPYNLTFPEDLPIRVLGSQVQVFFQGNCRLRQGALMSEDQCVRFHAAITIALKTIRDKPYTHFRHLISESMTHLSL